MLPTLLEGLVNQVPLAVHSPNQGVQFWQLLNSLLDAVRATAKVFVLHLLH